MDWLLIAIPAGGLAAGAFAIALSRAATALRHVEGETQALAQLGLVESPTGKPFFPDGDSLWELAAQLEDSEVRAEKAGRR